MANQARVISAVLGRALDTMWTRCKRVTREHIASNAPEKAGVSSGCCSKNDVSAARDERTTDAETRCRWVLEEVGVELFVPRGRAERLTEPEFR